MNDTQRANLIALRDELATKRWVPTKMVLSEGGNKRCCLGVGCEISGIGKWAKRPITYHDLIYGDRKVFEFKTDLGSDSALLPERVSDYYGIGTEGELYIPETSQRAVFRFGGFRHYSLSEVNDGQCKDDFQPVIDCINAYLNDPHKEEHIIRENN